MAQFEKLFSPFNIGQMRIKNRRIQTPNVILRLACPGVALAKTEPENLVVFVCNYWELSNVNGLTPVHI